MKEHARGVIFHPSERSLLLSSQNETLFPFWMNSAVCTAAVQHSAAQHNHAYKRDAASGNDWTICHVVTNSQLQRHGEPKSDQRVATKFQLLLLSACAAQLWIIKTHPAFFIGRCFVNDLCEIYHFVGGPP
jgi:hypothetical protein